MSDDSDCVLAEFASPVKTQSEMQAELRRMGTLSRLKEVALDQQKRDDGLRRQRVRELQSFEVVVDLTATPTERLMKACRAATIISQYMPLEASNSFLAEVIRTAMH